MAQPYWPKRAGEAPAMDASSGSSTTALMAVPGRVRNRNSRIPTATAAATITTVSWCQVTTTPRIETELPAKNCGSTRDVVGSQTIVASPMRSRSRPIVTVSVVSTDAPCNGRMSTRSISAPISGANTKRTRTRATGVGRPWFTDSSQYMKAATMPMAPWAKLKIPEVV